MSDAFIFVRKLRLAVAKSPADWRTIMRTDPCARWICIGGSGSPVGDGMSEQAASRYFGISRAA